MSLLKHATVDQIGEVSVAPDHMGVSGGDDQDQDDALPQRQQRDHDAQ